MPSTPESTSRFPAVAAEADRLECPRCRRPAEDSPRRRNGHCPACGLRMVPSVRRSEVEAWRQLYGGPPRGLP